MGRRLVSRCKRTSATSASQSAAVSFRCSSEVNVRSEEHTSELQSLRHLVCRLLLDTATTEIYTLSLHDALPILVSRCKRTSATSASQSAAVSFRCSSEVNV